MVLDGMPMNGRLASWLSSKILKRFRSLAGFVIVAREREGERERDSLRPSSHPGL